MSDVEQLTHDNHTRRRMAEEAAASQLRKELPAPRKRTGRDTMKRLGEKSSWVLVGAASSLAGVYTALQNIDGVIVCAVTTLAAITAAVWCEYR